MNKKLIQKCATLCHEIYQTAAEYSGNKTGCDFSIHKTDTHTFITWRGSDESSDWYQNINAQKNNHGYHTGFYESAIESEIIMPELNPTKKLILSGHSKGGATASIFGELLKSKYNQTSTVITFAAPKYRTQDNVNTRTKSMHIRALGDVVPCIPMGFTGFENNSPSFFIHNGQLIKDKNISSWQQITNIRTGKHSMDNYIKLILQMYV